MQCISLLGFQGGDPCYHVNLSTELLKTLLQLDLLSNFPFKLIEQTVVNLVAESHNSRIHVQCNASDFYQDIAETMIRYLPHEELKQLHQFSFAATTKTNVQTVSLN